MIIYQKVIKFQTSRKSPVLILISMTILKQSPTNVMIYIWIFTFIAQFFQNKNFLLYLFTHFFFSIYLHFDDNNDVTLCRNLYTFLWKLKELHQLKLIIEWSSVHKCFKIRLILSKNENKLYTVQNGAFQKNLILKIRLIYKYS